MTAGIVIVTWQSGSVIGPCLDACRSAAPLSPVVVVDNASSDSTLHEVRSRPWAALIRNDSNRGFAAAVNQGVAFLATDLVLLLNPDARLQSPLGPLLQAFDDPRVGAAGGMLLDRTHQPQRGFQVRRLPTPAALACEALGLNRLFPRNPVNRRYRALELDPALPADVEQPAGAFLMLRRAAWRQVRGFDEGYFPAWFDDVDFLARLRDAGWRVRYEPGAVAAHEGGHSFRSISWVDKRLYWYGSLLRYAARHFKLSGRSLVCGAVVAASFPRAITGIVVNRSAHPLIVYGRVLRLAVQVWVAGSKALDAGAEGSAAADTRRPLL